MTQLHVDALHDFWDLQIAVSRWQTIGKAERGMRQMGRWEGLRVEYQQGVKKTGERRLNAGGKWEERRARGLLLPWE